MMALQKRGKYYYSDSQLDIESELSRYSKANGYPTTQYAGALCGCAGQVFHLLLDDQGVAVRQCVGCNTEHPMGDSGEFLEEAELEACECPCGANSFEITVGVALYKDSEDVRWLYIGCRCVSCGLTATYGDWKNEAIDFREFLRRV